jgi:hypothetical protein
VARACTVCAHAERRAIDRELVGGSLVNRDIARRHGLDKSAVGRHAATHLPASLLKAQEAEEVAQGDVLLGQVRYLQARAEAILDAAEKAGDYRSALGAIGQARACLELLAKLLGELDERPQVNVALSGEWLTLRAVLLGALGPYPEARTAVAGRLLALENGTNGRHS